MHVSIAGGRKTRGFLAGYTLSLLGRPQDRLSHEQLTQWRSRLHRRLIDMLGADLAERDMIDASGEDLRFTLHRLEPDQIHSMGIRA